MATRSKQASEARADFWLRAEADRRRPRRKRCVTGGARLVARGCSSRRGGALLLCLSRCTPTSGALGPKKAFPKSPPKEASKMAKAGTRSAFGAQLPKKGCQPASEPSICPISGCPASPRLVSIPARRGSQANFHRRWSSICVRLVQAAALHAGLSGDLPSLFRRSNKRNIPQFGVLATRHRKLLVIVKLPLRLPLASVAAGRSGRSRARIGGTL